jgi:Lrp/AsnC family transcriptional regulator for asnA, asnC and gidA
MLLTESRISFTEIAKECKISVGAARMRYNHLKRVGVINGEIMQVNPYSLGYKCVGNIGINTSAEKEKEVRKFLEEQSTPNLLLNSWGKYNIGIIVSEKNIEQWAGLLRHLESNPDIKQVDPLIWTEPTGMDHPENLEIKPIESKQQGKKIIRQHPAAISNEQKEIDEIDRQIAEILVHNSRTSFRKIAEKLKISTKKVIQRYKKLKGNMLTLSAITLDLKKLGYNAKVEIFLKCERSKMSEIRSKILQMPNVIVFIGLIGSYDLLAIAALEDFDALISLEKGMRAIRGVEQIDFFVSEIFPAWPLSVYASLVEKGIPQRILPSKRTKKHAP